MNKKALKAAFPYTIPVMMGYLFLGIAFGILLGNKGYHFGWAILMSVFIFAGSMQFVAIGLLTSGFQIIAAAVLTLLVNARHLFYGLSMFSKFQNMGRKKPYMIFSLTDETFALLCSAKPSEDVDLNRFYFFIALLDHLYWITGSAIGGIVGSLFTFNTKGIDFVMTALFVVIFTEQWEGSRNHVSALIGILASFLSLLLFGPDHFIVPAMLMILFTLAVIRKPMERGGKL